MKIEAVFTVKSTVQDTVDIDIDWDSDSAGTLVTQHPGLKADGVQQHVITQVVPTAKTYKVKISGKHIDGASGYASNTVEVVAVNSAPVLTLISAKLEEG